MHKVRYIQLSAVLLMGVIAASTFCGFSVHHMESMSNVSPSCDGDYLITALPQSSQERGAPLAFLSILILLVLYPTAGIKVRGNSAGESRPTFLSPENTRGHHPLMELFRRGILHPKIYNLALIRN